MPLTLAEEGKTCIVQKVGGKEETRRFLEALGISAGGEVTLLCKNGGNVIVHVKESRIALSAEMAQKILVH